MSKYDWVTPEMMGEALEAELAAMKREGQLIPYLQSEGDLWTQLMESLNNTLLERLCTDHDRCRECGLELNDLSECRDCDDSPDDDEEEEDDGLA